MGQLTNLLTAVAIALVTVALFYFTPVGRRLRYRMIRKRVTRLSAEHKADVLMRVVAGPPGRLGTRCFQIVAVGAPRTPLRGREKFWGDPNVRIVALTTPDATVELAVPPPYGPDMVFARLAH